MQKYNKYLFPIILVIIFSSCKNKGRYDIDVSDIPIAIEIKRFDKDIYSLTEKNYEKRLEEIKNAHPLMFELYVERISMAGRIDDTIYISRLKQLVFDRYVKELYRDVSKKFTDMSDIEKDFNEAFKHVKYYFPDDTIPAVYSMVSNLSYYGCVTYDNLLVVSLDMFLGSDYIYYPGKWPEYKIRTFREEYIVSESLKAFFGSRFPEDKFAGNTLLSKMVYYGKRLFYIDLMMPDLHDSIKIQYTKEQLDWCKENEGEVWNHLVTNKVLYETDDRKIFRYFSDGPFTNAYGVPPESSPRLGEWVGWQIIKSFVNNNSELDLKNVFYEDNVQNILTLAKYKPKN